MTTGSGGGDSRCFGLCRGLVRGEDLRRRLLPVEMGSLGASSADAPWLLGRLRLRLSRISSSRGDVILLSGGDVILLSSYSTVTMLALLSTSEVSDLLAGRCRGVEMSSAESEPRGEVRARGLRRILTTSTGSFCGFGHVDRAASSSLFTSSALPEPLLAGLSSALEGFEGLRCLTVPFFCPVLLPTYETKAVSGGARGCGDFSGDGGFRALTGGSGGALGTILVGRTQALGIVLGAGRALSFGGDCLLRQRESLTTRFLGVVAASTSSSRTLCTMGATGVFLGLVERSRAASTDLLCVWAGFQFGLLSSVAFVLGVVGGLGEGGAGFGGLSEDAPATASGSTSCCQRLILSFTLAGLLMPIAFAKSGPFMLLVAPSLAPFFLPGGPFLCAAGVSGSLGSGETIKSRRHWDCEGVVVTWGVVFASISRLVVTFRDVGGGLYFRPAVSPRQRRNAGGRAVAERV